MENQLIKWPDSHAHLSGLSRSELLTACQAVSGVLNVATDLRSSYAIVKQASQKYSYWMGCAVGLSAPEIEYAEEEWEEELLKLLKEPQVVAIGEIGIDGINKSYPSFGLQKTFFVKQLVIAVENNLPVIIHSRGAEEEALAICLEHHVKKAIFHCFTGTKEVALKILEAGYYISLSGIITFKNSGLEEMAKSIWFDRLLLETDTPYLAPEPLRGTTNIPNNVAYIGKKVAQLRGVPEGELAIQVQKNMEQILQISI